MTYEANPETDDLAAIETLHERLAAEHGRDNVFVTSTTDGVVKLVGDGIGEYLMENDVEVETGDYVPNVDRAGHSVSKRYGLVNFVEHMKIVGVHTDAPHLGFKTDEVEFGHSAEQEWFCHDCSYIPQGREDARNHVLLTAVDEGRLTPADIDVPDSALERHDTILENVDRTDFQ